MGFLNIYPNIPVSIVDGKGPYLFDKSNKRYLDLIGGLGVNILGYHDSEIDEALTDSSKCPHLSNLYRQSLREEIAQKLNSLCGTHSVFFTNSGTESNEAAIKFAWKENPGKILAFEGSFHGRSLGSYSLSHLFKWQTFPRIDAVIEFVNWNDPDDLKLKGRDASILIFEPIQGAAGVRVMNPECTDIIRDMQNNGVIVIADEIQSGMGRTGSFLASHLFNIDTDITTLAKGLGGGLPLGAVCMKENIALNINIGDHGTTMGGNLRALKLAGVVLDKLKDGLMEHVQYLERGVVEDYRDKLNLRGRGIFIGFDVNNSSSYMEAMLYNGYLVNILGENTVRLLPPYIVEEKQLREFFKLTEDLVL